jgi:hypothetical protein
MFRLMAQMQTIMVARKIALAELYAFVKKNMIHHLVESMVFGIIAVLSRPVEGSTVLGGGFFALQIIMCLMCALKFYLYQRAIEERRTPELWYAEISTVMVGIFCIAVLFYALFANATTFFYRSDFVFVAMTYGVLVETFVFNFSCVYVTQVMTGKFYDGEDPYPVGEVHGPPANGAGGIQMTNGPTSV